MNQIGACIAHAWRKAVAGMGGDVVDLQWGGDGMELHAVFSQAGCERYLRVCWYQGGGVVCQGDQSDIRDFHSMCEKAGFRFELGELSLCG